MYLLRLYKHINVFVFVFLFLWSYISYQYDYYQLIQYRFQRILYEQFEQQTVLVRRNGQYINEIVIANASQQTDAMLVINGHINMEYLDRIINDQKNYFNR